MPFLGSTTCHNHSDIDSFLRTIRMLFECPGFGLAVRNHVVHVYSLERMMRCNNGLPFDQIHGKTVLFLCPVSLDRPTSLRIEMGKLLEHFIPKIACHLQFIAKARWAVSKLLMFAVTIPPSGNVKSSDISQFHVPNSPRVLFWKMGNNFEFPLRNFTIDFVFNSR